MNKYLNLFIFIIINFFVTNMAYATVPKNQVNGQTSVVEWENTRDQAFSISGNYDSGIDSIGISVTSDVTPRTIDISSNLNPGYHVKLFTIYTDQDLVVKIYGSGINCFWNLGYINSMVRAGKSVTWEFNDITSIDLLKPSSGATNPTVDFYLRTIRDKELINE